MSGSGAIIIAGAYDHPTWRETVVDLGPIEGRGLEVITISRPAASKPKVW